MRNRVSLHIIHPAPRSTPTAAPSKVPVVSPVAAPPEVRRTGRTGNKGRRLLVASEASNAAMPLLLVASCY